MAFTKLTSSYGFSAVMRILYELEHMAPSQVSKTPVVEMSLKVADHLVPGPYCLPL